MNDLLVSLVLICAWLLVLVPVLRRYSVVERTYIRWSVALHIVCALSIVPITVYVLGGGDMLGYYDRGTIYAQVAREDPIRIVPALVAAVLRLEPEIPILGLNVASATASMSALSGLLVLLTNDSLYGACLIVTLGSFFAKLSIYNVFHRLLPEVPVRRLLVAALLIPSVVFWSSGLLKEPVAMVGFGIFWSGVYALFDGFRYKRALVGLVGGIVLVAVVKAYWLVPLGAALGTWVITYSIRARLAASNRVLALLFGTILAGTLISGTAAIFPRYSMERFTAESSLQRSLYARIEGGSSFTLIAEESEDEQLPLAALPLALFTVLLRPAVFDAQSAVQLVNAVEMTAFAWMILLAWRRCGIVGSMRICATNPFLAFCCVFVLGLAVGVGLSTTNLGTLSRYRIPMMPFYAVILFTLGSQARKVIGQTTHPGFDAARVRPRRSLDSLPNGRSAAALPPSAVTPG